jgi:hypothetical protein
MSPLARSQRDFLAVLFGDEAVPRAGLATYRRNVFANLRGALAATYPVVLRLVGAAFFGEAAERFARACPSTSGDLNRYGGEFGAFLAAYPFARELPYLADVARLEWACHESFNAADAAPLDVAMLAAVPPERHAELCFRLHPAVRLVASAHPVISIREANQPDRDGTPTVSSGAEHALVRREGFDVRVDRLTPVEWKFVAALALGDSLEAALDAALHAAAGPGLDVPADTASDVAAAPALDVAANPAAGFLGPLLVRLAAGGVLAGFIAPEGAA